MLKFTIIYLFTLILLANLCFLLLLFKFIIIIYFYYYLASLSSSSCFIGLYCFCSFHLNSSFFVLFYCPNLPLYPHLRSLQFSLHFFFKFKIHRQFPLSFEFNQYFLQFLAYHYVSNRFRTFMLDNEFERIEAGWLLEDRRGGSLAVEEVDQGLGFSPKHGICTSSGASLWDYIDKHHRKSAIFYNFMYSPQDQEPVRFHISSCSILD